MTAPRSIDWAAIRARLERAADVGACGASGATDPDAVREVLRARARELARPAQAPDAVGLDGADAMQVLVFELGGARYAVDTDWVAEACALPPLTALPGLPTHVAGVAAFRGQVLAVLELRALLSLPVIRLAEPTALVVLRGESMEFALLADAIVGVGRYARAALADTLPGLGALRAGYLLGVAPDRTAVLDAGRMLADRSLVVDGR